MVVLDSGRNFIPKTFSHFQDNLDEEIKKARQAAKTTFIKSERMNIRISPKDLNGLKREGGLIKLTNVYCRLTI